MSEFVAIHNIQEINEIANQDIKYKNDNQTIYDKEYLQVCPSHNNKISKINKIETSKLYDKMFHKADTNE